MWIQLVHFSTSKNSAIGQKTFGEECVASYACLIKFTIAFLPNFCIFCSSYCSYSYHNYNRSGGYSFA